MQETRAVPKKLQCMHDAVVSKLISASRGSPCDSMASCTDTLYCSGAMDLVMIGLHAQPDAAVEEMDALVKVHTAVKRKWKTDNILILGDLNADCSYASDSDRAGLKLRTDKRFKWLIGDGVDTTTSATDCAYDRCVSDVIIRPHCLCR